MYLFARGTHFDLHSLMTYPLNRNSFLLEEIILEQYDFRKNLVNKLTGKSSAEYKRKSEEKWFPLVYFIRKERSHVLKHKTGRDELSKLQNAPDWLFNKVLSKAIKNAERYIPNPHLLQIIDEKPTILKNVKPNKIHEREAVELIVGEKCYVSLGVRKGWLGHRYSVLPGVVDSIRSDGFNEYYNVFLLKYNEKADKIEYHGRHMLFKNEVGKTPEQAVANMAKSQLIY